MTHVRPGWPHVSVVAWKNVKNYWIGRRVIMSKDDLRANLKQSARSAASRNLWISSGDFSAIRSWLISSADVRKRLWGARIVPFP